MAKPSSPGSARSWIARHRLALMAGITAFVMTAGGTAGWAYFTASVGGTGSLSTQSVSVTQAGFGDMDEKYLPSELSATGSFTVTNTGSIDGTATVTIAAPQSWASGLPIRVWPTTAAACGATNPPGAALSGTWAAPPALTPTLAAGASITYCVRTTIADWKELTSASGSQQANPAINVSLNAAGWVATTATGTSHVQQTAGMYPLTTGFFDESFSRWHTVRANAGAGYCLDVNASGGTGTAVIAYGCHSDSNQRWEFVPVAGTSQSLVTVRPRHAMGTRLTYSSGNGTIQTSSTGAAAQRWYVQQIDANRFQLVSAVTGLCLSLTATSSAAAAMVACDSSSAQLRFEREPLTMATSGSTITLTFGGSNIPGGTLQRCTNAACTSWTAVASIASGATSVSFGRTNIPNNSTATFRIIDGSSNVLWDGIQLRRTNTSTVAAVAGIG